jgi:hypothetical protein
MDCAATCRRFLSEFHAILCVYGAQWLVMAVGMIGGHIVVTPKQSF